MSVLLERAGGRKYICLVHDVQTHKGYYITSANTFNAGAAISYMSVVWLAEKKGPKKEIQKTISPGSTEKREIIGAVNFGAA